ncbi:MAG TPA: hypothetical protein VME66_03845 [Candidatus Acidoferrales bacterium]|nr:hypothetical protein [Candidatus Acidoferrales bacterium]
MQWRRNTFRAGAARWGLPAALAIACFVAAMTGRAVALGTPSVAFTPAPALLSTTVENYANNQVTFTLENSSQSSDDEGYFVINSVTPSVPADVSVTSYAITTSSMGTCTLAAVTSLSSLNSTLASSGCYTPHDDTVTIVVQYQVTGGVSSGTLSFSMNADIVAGYSSYGNPVSGGPVTSATASASDSGATIDADARLDVEVSPPPSPTATGTPLVWTIYANNGGPHIAKGSTSAAAWLGSSSTNGIIVFDKLPSYGGTVLGMTATPTVTLTSVESGVSSQIYYSTAATPGSGSGSWSTTYNANATWIAVYLYLSSGTSGGSILAANSGAGTSAGSVTSSEAQFHIVIDTNQPTACGSQTAGSVSDMANSVILGNAANSLQGGVFEGPGSGVAGSLDTGSVSFTNVETNTTESSGTSEPGGASNTATSQAYSIPVCLSVGSGSATNSTVTQDMLNAVTFTLTNTGTASGNFNVPSAATLSGSATVYGYILNSASSGTCSGLTPCSLSTLNTQLALSANLTAANGTLKIGVVYQVSSSATIGSSITSTTLGATITNGSTTSSTISGSDTTGETVNLDARLDLEETASAPTAAATPIAWTITANNGGGEVTKGSPTVESFLPSAPSDAIAIFAQVPTYNGVSLGLTSAPTVTLGSVLNSATATVYYSTSTSTPGAGSSYWTTTYTASATWIAVAIGESSSTSILPSAPSGSSGAGSVTTPQITIVVDTNQPVGCGANTSNDVSMVFNAAIGGMSTIGSVYRPPLIAATVAQGTQDNGTLSLTNTLTNTTASSGTTIPGGSMSASSQGAVSSCVVTGPVGTSSALGSYPAGPNYGSATATNNLDFTAVSFACANGNAINDGVTLCTVPSGGITVPSQVKNSGTATDNFTLTVTAPAGWTAQIYSVTSCPTPPPYPSCPASTSISSVSSVGGSVTSSSFSLGGGGAVKNYDVVYNASSGVTPFVAADALITASGSVGTGGDVNTTHQDIYPGGVIKLTKSVTVVSTNCPSGASPSPPAGTVCPGGVLQYSVAYANVAPIASTTTNVGTQPAWSYAALYPEAGQLVITENGSVGNWGANTFGLNAAPTATTSGTTFAYSGGSAFASGTYPSMTAGYTSFTATIGGSTYQLPPGGSGTITFNVTVR